ncbi:hypothetical protein AX15_004425 [Amanita polypyramis BW_CC]|nr:hypothetical protein AX15_004425 [Amanita polypyramis BW_CC]
MVVEQPATALGGGSITAAPASTLADVLSPVSLPCSGRIIANKLVKVSLYEHLALMFGGPPNHLHFGLYKTWGQSNWGVILTGNFQVSKRHLALGRDVIVPEELTEDNIRPFRMLASVIHNDSPDTEQGRAELESRSHHGRRKPLALMQLSHGGRQSCNITGGRRLNEPPLAPSAVRVTGNVKGLLSKLLHKALFLTPKEMTLEDIDDVVRGFVRGTTLAWKAGFDGVQFHVAHGYLLSEFISPKTNRRQDQYSADKDNALRLLKRIIDDVKAIVPDDFVLSVKINSADYVDSQSSDDAIQNNEKRITEHVLTMAKWGVFDFIEFSGGDYEEPNFMVTVDKSRRQAFFSRFSHHIMGVLDSLPEDTQRPFIVLTGGLRTPSHLCTVLTSRHADLLGIGRGSLLRPDLPLYLEEIYNTSKIMNDDAVWDTPFEREPELETKGISGWIWDRFPKLPLIGAGVQMAWYGNMIRRLGSANESLVNVQPLVPDYTLGALGSVVKMWFWSLPARKYDNERSYLEDR